MTETEFVPRAEAVKARLYRSAYLYLGSEAQALDAVDEAVYKGLCACKKLRQPEFFETWMTRILLNICAAECKRRKREIATAELPETATEVFDSLPLRDAVARLPGDLRQVIILRYFTGLTLTETAESLAIPQGTVVTRQRRALAVLKLSLSEEEIT
ncbi:MAG: sigma-70 family RNA polymerase sigma factor [Pseudoflavonifractor sp.]